MPNTLMTLMDHHERLDALFAEHREALVGLDLDRAKERLEVWSRALFAHMEHEEKKILPRYALLPKVRGGGVDFFLGEHQRLRERIAEVKERLDPLDPTTPGLKTRVVDLFDRLALLRGILEHHDLRERQLLYPRLDEATTEDERRALLEGAPAPP
jgi:hemerythrin superfamily protein